MLRLVKMHAHNYISFMKIFILMMLILPLRLFAQITVSGISSGAYMAQQLHVAHSKMIKGAGIIAGGPFFCSRGSATLTIVKCMTTLWGIPELYPSLIESEKLERNGSIDKLSNLKEARIFLLSGTEDKTVELDVMKQLYDLYVIWEVSTENIHFEQNLNVGHAFPTMNSGNKCSTPAKSPFISNCQYDGAGKILKHLMGPLNPPVSMKESNLVKIKMQPDIRSSMRDEAYAYIPQTCKTIKCPIHIAFHGCQQTLDDIGFKFILETGFNEWAESNHMIILYPQIRKNKVTNPNGCWDWWGYTGTDFHTKNGIQIKTVMSLLEKLTGLKY